MTHHPDRYRRLARRAWSRHHGRPVPRGYEIHHKDFDDTNFDIDNLECLTTKEHKARHKGQKSRLMLVCQHCGESFKPAWILGRRARYCSNACKSAARRASGVDDEDRICAKCGKVYRTNRYRKQRFCSLICSEPGSYARKPKQPAW